jgi:hypothetical protein
MGDASSAARSLIFNCLSQGLYLALTLNTGCSAACIKHGNAGRIIAAILKALEAFN